MNLVETQVAGKTLRFETGRIVKQADGGVLVSAGETQVIVTAQSGDPREGIDFFPLTVEYIEKTYAVGQIPKSFFRREGRPSNDEVLNARIIDRSIRPLFPEAFRAETQVIATVISSDIDHEPEILALNGASAALHLSSMPWAKPIAGVRVARVDGKIVVFPTREERDRSDLSMIVAASADSILMVEGGGKMVGEEVILEALEAAHAACKEIVKSIEDLRGQAGKEKLVVEAREIDAGLRDKVIAAAKGPLSEALQVKEKLPRYAKVKEVKKAVIAQLTEELGEDFDAQAASDTKRVFEDLKSEIVRERIIKEETRIDGRGLRDVRDIACETGWIPRTHGSALFTRGETQVMATITLGTERDEQLIDTIKGEYKKKFLLHYNFPPFSVGEVKRLGSVGRREIGHGALAERAIVPVLPESEDFPYTIRIGSEVLESNGSSSMGTVCATSLALMDGGAPIAAQVAGVAMGLIVADDGGFKILTDILGDEDHLGDMDFKVAGTADGVNAIQMDIKTDGISIAMMKQALEQAKEGRLHILGEMNKAIDKPREELNKYAPRIVSLHIPVDKIRVVIGSGGETIKGIVAETGCTVDVNDDGLVKIASSDLESMARAKAIIEGLTEEAQVGRLYMGTVRRIVDFGAFVEIFPGTEGLLHISQLENHRVKSVEDVLKEGEEVLVECIEVDRQNGKIRLSRKAAFGKSLADNDKASL